MYLAIFVYDRHVQYVKGFTTQYQAIAFNTNYFKRYMKNNYDIEPAYDFEEKIYMESHTALEGGERGDSVVCEFFGSAGCGWLNDLNDSDKNCDWFVEEVGVVG